MRRLAAAVALAVGVLAPSSVPQASTAAAISDQSGIAGQTVVAGPRDAPQSATILIDANAKSNGYTTPNITLAQGGVLNVWNRDSIRHSVTSDDHDASGNSLFSLIVNPNDPPTRIPEVSNLAPGTYQFHCSFHSAFMRGTLTITGSGGGVTPAAQTFDQSIVIPKKLTTASIRIPIKQVGVRVLPTGPLTTMWTYGGTFPGPTIVRPAGHDTKVTFVNKLPTKSSLSMHFHGDHHAWTADGQPSRFLIAQGKAVTYDFRLTDGGHPERAAFQYYHDHRMNVTTRNNWKGLQGMFIVTDGWAGKLGLPTGRYDVPLMVSERSFNANNQLVAVPPHGMMTKGPLAPPNDGTVGDHILVNGRYAPYFNVYAHRYRLRLLNTSPFTTYDFALSDGRPLVQIGTGNGLLPKSVVRQDILLGPAQRADVVVDFRGELGTNVVLESIPRPNPPKNGAGSPSAQLMQFRVTASATDTTKLPSTLEPAPKMTIPKKVSAVWAVGVTGSATNGASWTLDGKAYDPKRVVLKVSRGSTQMWELRNPTNVTHFIHIHEEQWRTVLRDGKAPPAWERGLEDTWRLDPGERVRVVAKFTDYLGVFMIHCHMLDHEDDGLMAQFAVVDSSGRLPSGYRYDPSGGPVARARTVAAPRVATAPATKTTSPLVSDLSAGWMCEPDGGSLPRGAALA
jgi:FtsP/CotA-like multicopper oxidase with cupredoxin domain/plastocyanin